MSVVVKGNAELEKEEEKKKKIKLLIVKNFCRSTEMPPSV